MEICQAGGMDLGVAAVWLQASLALRRDPFESMRGEAPNFGASHSLAVLWWRESMGGGDLFIEVHIYKSLTLRRS